MKHTIWLCIGLAAGGCATVEDGIEDGEHDVAVSDGKLDGFGIADGSLHAELVLAVANTFATDRLYQDVGLTRRVARNIVGRRPLADLGALDAVPYVGQRAFDALVIYARGHVAELKPTWFDLDCSSASSCVAHPGWDPLDHLDEGFAVAAVVVDQLEPVREDALGLGQIWGDRAGAIDPTIATIGDFAWHYDFYMPFEFPHPDEIPGLTAYIDLTGRAVAGEYDGFDLAVLHPEEVSGRLTADLGGVLRRFATAADRFPIQRISIEGNPASGVWSIYLGDGTGRLARFSARSGARIP